jgi:Tol biopolymer transport system component
MSPGDPLLTVRPDGSRVRRLTSPGRRQFDGSLYAVAASPDGRSATFLRKSDDVNALKLVSLRTRRLRTLSTGPPPPDGPPSFATPLVFAPAPWSANGRWIAVARGGIDAWLMRPDGSGGHVLDVGGPFSPRAFSPNGRCLVGFFGGGPGANAQLGIVPASGGAPARVPDPPGPFRVVEAMRWTPNGRQLVFTGRVGSKDGLYRMAPDGTGLRRLARVRTAGDAAVFSPDGRLMAYNDRRGTMVRPVAGGRARRLLIGLWVKAWAPRPR